MDVKPWHPRYLLLVIFTLGVCYFAPATVFAQSIQYPKDEVDLLAAHPEETQLYEQVSRVPPMAESSSTPSLFERAGMALERGGLGASSSFGKLFGPLLTNFFQVEKPFPTPVANTPQSSASAYPEIREILALSNTDERSKVYRKLIERVGPVEAQEALYHAGLPFNGETHLLQHTVGEYLYEMEGRPGVTKCTLYFLAACYHGFIISLLEHEGLNALPGVMKECGKVGLPIAAQCSHGIGHGLVAWYGYKNLDQALRGCDELAKKSKDFRVLSCYDGAFMENQWALHSGTPSKDQWLSNTDPHYPCDDPRIKDAWQVGCWLNQGSIMYQFFKGDIKKTSDACLKVEDQNLRKTCFNSLSRQIHPLTSGDYSAIVRTCGKLDPAWKDYCLETIAISEFSVGGRSLPYKICENIKNDEKQECYNGLSGIIGTYATNRKELESLCAPISDATYRSRCLNSKHF